MSYYRSFTRQRDALRYRDALMTLTGERPTVFINSQRHGGDAYEVSQHTLGHQWLDALSRYLEAGGRCDRATRERVRPYGRWE